MNIFKSAHKLLGLFVALAAVLFAVAPVRAGQILSAKVALSDSRPGQSNTHTFTFTPPTTGNIGQFVFKYCKRPSASDGSCIAPEGFAHTNAALGTLGGALNGDDLNWTLDKTANAYTLKVDATSPYAHNGSSSVVIPFTTINNHTIASENNDTCDQDSNNSSDTCYVRITTSATVGGATVDEGAVSYTVVNQVVVQARVDPSFTFVVAGVAASTTNNGITTSALSTAGTLPFGNLAVGVPKYVAHSLTVTTNTLNGYAISAKMLTQMTGGFASNNIDPFVGGGATASDPKVWSVPNGTTSNTNTGWLGYNTTDTDVTGFNPGTNLFGPLGATDVTVMQGSASDPGTTPIYVSYVVGVNVYQPADTYTGTLLYNALPTY